MRKVFRVLIVISTLVLLAIAYLYISSMYVSSEARARIVDGESGQPVADAVVLANWQEKGIEGYPLGSMSLFELTTDAQGAVTIPGWGPRFASLFGRIRNSEPVIRIFRPGYVPAVLKNQARGTFEPPEFMKPSIDGAVIKLQPLRAPLAEYARELELFADSIQFLYWHGRCEWHQAPRTVLAAHRLRSELQGNDVATRFVAVDHILGPPECGTGREFFKGDLG